MACKHNTRVSRANNLWVARTIELNTPAPIGVIYFESKKKLILIAGKPKTEQMSQQMNIDLEHLRKGIYAVKIYSESNTASKKIIAE
ncbi:MAG: hypothetical protein ACI9CP_001832 [Cryomorphaceae bacterium]|jgi:hypothetical protein